MNWRFSVVCLLLLCASVSRGEQYSTYLFSTDDMTFSDGNRVACFKGDSLVYRCSTGTVFGINSGQLAALLENTNDSLTISPAIHKLSSIQVNYNPSDKGRRYLKVYVSTNASDWTEATYMTYGNGSVQAVFPSGDYFVKIVNTKGTEDVYVRGVQYGIRDCNCQLYVAP